jgi:hypothetical protein
MEDKILRLELAKILFPNAKFPRCHLSDERVDELIAIIKREKSMEGKPIKKWNVH